MKGHYKRKTIKKITAVLTTAAIFTAVEWMYYGSLSHAWQWVTHYHSFTIENQSAMS